MSHSSSSTIPADPAPLQAAPPAPRLNADGEPILCNHCGRTATNGISCEGYCVADSGY